QQVGRGQDGAASVLGAGDAGDEQRHDLVADELVDDGVVTDQDGRGRAIEVVHEVGEGASADALAQSAGVPHVGEEHGDVELQPSGRQVVAAARAEVGILPGR